MDEDHFKRVGGCNKHTAALDQLLDGTHCKALFRLILLASTACLLAAFGVYAIHNPDPEAFYFNGELYDGEQAEVEGQDDGDWIDIHARFVIWFRWGLAQLAAYLVILKLPACGVEKSWLV